MEDSKNSFVSFFKLPWVKALIAFIIFLLIFLAGVAFGSHFGGHHYTRRGGFMGFQTMKGQRGNIMYGSNKVGIPVNGGSINIQGQQRGSTNNGASTNGSTTE